MDKSILFLLIDLIVIIALVVFKTVYFIRATRHRSFVRWLHFTRFDIINSMTEFTQREKKRQNRLSVALLVVVLLSAVAFYLLMKYKASFTA